MAKIFVLNFIFFFSISVFGNECNIFLASQSEIQNLDNQILTIPGRGNQFRRDDLLKLNTLNQYRVIAVARALAVLNDQEIVQAVQSMNQPLSYFLKPGETFEAPAELHEIIKGHPLTNQILETHNYFTAVLRGYNYPPQTLAGLSLLFYQIPRPKKPVLSFATPGIDDPNLKLYEVHRVHLRKLIDEPTVARIVIAFLKHPEVKVRTQKALDDKRELFRQVDELEIARILAQNPKINIEVLRQRSEKQILAETSLNVEKIENEFLRNRKFSKEVQTQIAVMLITFADVINDYFDFKIIQFHNSSDKPESDIHKFEEMPWQFRLSLIEDFLVETLGFKSSLYDMATLLDHIRYGSSLPVSNSVLESSVQQALKLWLMPVRAEVTQFNIANRESQLPEVFVSSVFNNQVFLNSAPPKNTNNVVVLNPNKRKNQQSRNRTEPASRASDVQAPKVAKIPDEINLIHFTEFSDQPRSLYDLKADTEYNFRFMRLGEDSKIETVFFPENVLKEILKEKDASEHLMRALVLGPARISNQDGVKILKRKHTTVEGRYYEVKSTKTAHRIILLHQDDRWEAVVFTDKNNFDRIQNNQL